MSGLASLHEGKRLVVLVGPGGVGKTTLAAALAADAAAQGRSVALLTIDPARRLAGALGLDRLGDALAPVPDAPGLEAAMLDTRASFDALVGRIARSEVERARILENRLYEAFSRTLARPHAYVAMERLHELLATSEDDRLVVLDTPPTRSALDILDAPGRLARFLDTKVADALVSRALEDGVRGWAQRSGRALVRALLGRVLGETLVDDLADFFEVFFHLRHGFAGRAAAIQAHLRAPSTAFVLVTAPDPSHLGDASALAEGLRARGVPLDALLSNRVHRIEVGGAAAPRAVAGASEPERWTDEERATLAAARAYRTRIAAEDARRREAAGTFAATHGIRRHLAFPWRTEAPTDVRALRALARAAVTAPGKEM
ncbi:MAG: hypothetical protein OHK0013_40980 [Sandaracinaceae bacterium]